MVFREIISCSISLEEALKVAYLGPETTFTHEATRRSFGASVDLEPQRTVAEVFARVERGEAQHGVVPVENSMEGAVTHTLDELMNSPLKICGEIYLPISQNLLSRELSLQDVRKVVFASDGPGPGCHLAAGRAARHGARRGGVDRRGRTPGLGRARRRGGWERTGRGVLLPERPGPQHPGRPNQRHPLYRAGTRMGR